MDAIGWILVAVAAFITGGLLGSIGEYVDVRKTARDGRLRIDGGKIQIWNAPDRAEESGTWRDY